jgi:hypothetical protein
MTPARLSTSRQNSRQVEDLPQLGMRKDVALHRRSVLVPRELVETLLVIDDKQDGLVLVDTLVGEFV